MEIEKKVLEIVRAKCLPGCEVQVDSSLEDDLGFDSLDVVECVIDVERAFGIHIKDEDAIDVWTPGDLVKIVEESNSATTRSECQSACGSCAAYGMEDAYGYGWCVKHDEPRGCSEEACGYYERRKEVRND